MPPLPAQNSAQVSNTPQGGFTLKANAELVLTNVVARDAKTGELVTGLKQSDFKIFENGKEQQIDTFDFESVDMATPLKEATVSGLAAGPTGQQSRGRRQARRAAQPPAHRHVLRPDLDAARRSGAQRGRGAEFPAHQIAAGRSCCAGLARRHAQRRPGFHRRQKRADQRGGRVQRHRGPGICAGRERQHQPGGGHHRLHARRERVQRPEHRPRAFRAARHLAVACQNQ